MPYDVLEYWTEAGRTYAEDLAAGRVGSGYAEQEAAIMELLGQLEFATVLDVGCGFGRIASLVAAAFPGAQITCVDLSADQLEACGERVPGAELVRSTLSDLDAGGRRWDLVLAVEVLMHTPPHELAAAVRRLRSLAARHLVTVDWTEPYADGRAIAPHNFLHDYGRLLGPRAQRRVVGRQSVFCTPVGRSR